MDSQYGLVLLAGRTLLALQSLAHLLGQVPEWRRPLLAGADVLLLALGTLVFLDSARVFFVEAAQPAVTFFLAPFFVLWYYLQLQEQSALAQVPLGVGCGAVLAATGIVFWRESRRREVGGGRLLAAAFLIWGAELQIGRAHV